jgi:hypothetical protein
MVGNFFDSLTASVTDQWTTLTGVWSEDIRVMIHRSCEELEIIYGNVLSASTSFWLPAQPERVFAYLRDGTTRNEVTNI